MALLPIQLNYVEVSGIFSFFCLVCGLFEKKKVGILYPSIPKQDTGEILKIPGDPALRALVKNMPGLQMRWKRVLRKQVE